MKGDFTRNTFDQFRHFSRVLMQQGRVQLDSDWNEQAAILLHYLQTLAADLIGPFGGPEGENFAFNGFKLTVSANNANDFAIGQGHYYVDGLLCENDRNDVTYFNQSDYPLTDNKLPAKTYLAYLDVWERHITALEESAIREVALGGPDTATRAKVVWQLKVIDKLPNGNDITTGIADIVPQWSTWVDAWNAQAHCQLKVRLKAGQAYTDPCTIAPDSMYRSQENQLYRVEIHTGGKVKVQDGQEPTFKWSRDNGSIAAAWLGNSEDGGLIVSNARGFAAGQWIEIMSKADDLLANPGKFNQIVRVEGDALYLAVNETFEEKVRKKVRRWDQQETEEIQLMAGAVPITEGTNDTNWIDLEDGIQVQFQPGGTYRTGDYWLIPARTVGTIDWPGDPKNPDAVAPHGITHHYAPLWIICAAADGTVGLNNDLRRPFAAIK